MKLILLAGLLFLTGCACMNSDTAFGLDGKAMSSCERGINAEKFCKRKPHHYDYYGVTCHSPCEISNDRPDCKSKYVKP